MRAIYTKIISTISMKEDSRLKVCTIGSYMTTKQSILKKDKRYEMSRYRRDEQGTKLQRASKSFTTYILR